MKISFYGRLQDFTREAERTVQVPPHVVDGQTLRAWLGEDDAPLLEALQAASVKMIVNDQVAQGDPPLCQDDEVAFFPPVSGG